jgi:hypothetical protein
MTRVCIVIALLAAAVAGCGPKANKSSTAGSPSAPATTTPGPTASPTSSPVVSASASVDFCALEEQIGIQSGTMQNKHFVSAQKETLEQLKALVTVSLARRADQEAAVPAPIKPAFVQVMNYFQYIADSNFQPTQATPEAAFNTVNAYLESACGFIYDK